MNEVLKDDYRVSVALNGPDALRRAGHVPRPEVILLDINMPKMDGYEVCKRLKEDQDTEDIVVIFITTMDTIGDEEKGLKLGAVDYITKPFSPTLVHLRVRNQLKMKQQNDILRNLADIDGLTGLANRRAFDRHLEQEWRRAFRLQMELSLILMDIDFFKTFNDTYGHAVGDDCLKKVAKSMSMRIGRGGDMVARYGGEEFVCVLPNTGRTGAAAIADKMREAIETLDIAHEDSPVCPHVTISLGVAGRKPGVGGDVFELDKGSGQQLVRSQRPRPEPSGFLSNNPPAEPRGPQVMNETLAEP